MAETQNKTKKKDRIVIEYYCPIKDLPGQEERKIIILSSTEAIERIAKAFDLSLLLMDSDSKIYAETALEGLLETVL